MENLFEGFRDAGRVKKLIDELKSYKGRRAVIMEVCGTHTAAICRYGICGCLPDGVELVSGPGCPVCVTPGSFINTAAGLATQKSVITATFGDMIRVPAGPGGPSLAGARAGGADVRIVYSPLDAAAIAAANRHKKVVFVSCGFETTAPVTALAILHAERQGLDNFSVLSSNKTMPAVLEALSGGPGSRISGYIYPGHVSAVIGMSLYEMLAEKYKVPGVVTGFEPVDILDAIRMLLKDIDLGNPAARNGYARVVRKEGNLAALDTMYEVFEECDTEWRGFGIIPASGLRIRSKYAQHDAFKVFGIGWEGVMGGTDAAAGSAGSVGSDAISGSATSGSDATSGSATTSSATTGSVISSSATTGSATSGSTVIKGGCRCGDVVRGICRPVECGLFGSACTPESPAGACMVSSEGACSAYYRYGRMA